VDRTSVGIPGTSRGREGHRGAAGEGVGPGTDRETPRVAGPLDPRRRGARQVSRWRV